MVAKSLSKQLVEMLSVKSGQVDVVDIKSEPLDVVAIKTEPLDQIDSLLSNFCHSFQFSYYYF